MRKKVILSILSALLCANFISCSMGSTSKSAQSSPSEETSDKDEQKSDDSSKDSNTSNSNDTSNNNDTSKKEDSSSVQKDARIFYYNIESDKIIYQNKKIEVKDGALANAVLDAYKGSLDDSCLSGLPDNVTIKSAKLDKDKDLITVNFGDTFVNTLGYGAGIESSILQSIVNSLGYNFGVSNVYITVNGKPYESGHIIKKENEAFKVKYDGCSEQQ